MNSQKMNITKQKKQKIYLILILLTMAFIWGNSLLPPQASWMVSNTVKKILSYFTPAWSSLGSSGGLSGAKVRKLAHFTEFFVLGGLLQSSARRESRSARMSLLIGMLTALIDETIQYYTGRTSSVFDVWIDISGVLAGTGIVLSWRRRSRRDKKPE